MLRRATADLAILLTHTPQGPYPYAGIPWYSTTFGRDGLITAMQCLWLDPRIALGVLKRLAAYQATDYRPGVRRRTGKNPARDACRRNGRAPRGSVRALLRQRRRDAAVRRAGRPLCADDRRSRHPARPVAGDRPRARLDRRPRRSRSRRLCRILQGDAARAEQPGLEGLLRCRLPRRRAACRRADRARRGTGLRLCGEKARFLVRRPVGIFRACAAARKQRRRSLRSGSRTPSGARTSAPMPSRSTATSSPAASRPRMPARS